MRQLRGPLLVLRWIGAEQLHLDVARGVELELTGLERAGDRNAARREIDNHGLVPLHQSIREQLVGTGLELEVLERINIQADRERVKNVDVSGSFATIRSIQPIPC